MEPSHYVGLDVSEELTSLCVIDEQGAIIWRGKCATEPLRVCRRLHSLRRWSYDEEDIKSVFS